MGVPAAVWIQQNFHSAVFVSPKCIPKRPRTGPLLSLLVPADYGTARRATLPFIGGFGDSQLRHGRCGWEMGTWIWTLSSSEVMLLSR